MKQYIKSWIDWVRGEEQSEKDPDNLETYIRFTYRSHIQKADKQTYYDSDSGWGCMLRVGQMFIANLHFKIKNKPPPEIVQLFYDSQMTPYSIQNFTKISKSIYPQKKQYQWYTPCQVGFIIKDLIHKYDQEFQVSICNDNTMFLNQIQIPKIKTKVVVILMCRIGLKSPEPQNLKIVTKFMQNQYFFAIMGGIPRRAHLFLKYKLGKEGKQGKFGYLDPHQTIRSPKTIEQYIEHQQVFASKLSWLSQSKIDSSMSICFVMDKEKVQHFYQSMEKLKEQSGKEFFLYLDKKRPQYSQSIESYLIEDS